MSYSHENEGNAWYWGKITKLNKQPELDSWSLRYMVELVGGNLKEQVGLGTENLSEQLEMVDEKLRG